MSTDATWLADMPDCYDRLLGPALFAPFAEHLARSAATFAPARVLELAAGTGITTRALRRALPDSEITATDLNAAMVAYGADHVADVTWLQADAQQLGFPDASFDLVVSQFGVMFFPDKPAAFRETARVLAAGGRMVFDVWDEVGTADFPAALVAALDVVLPDDPPSFVVRVPHGYSDPARIRADLNAGGLELEVIDHVVLDTRAPSAAALAEGVCRGTPLRFALQERGPLDELTQRIADEMTRRLGEGPVEGRAAAYLVTAREPSSIKSPVPAEDERQG